MGSKPIRSIFFTFLEPGNKLENFFSRKNQFFFGKNRDLSEIIGIFPKNRRFFAEIFLNDFSMDFSSPLQPITEKSVDFSDFLFPAYRILLTIPVTVASAERSFSKLKLIKSYLRSTISQERLNELTILSIEKHMLEQIDFNSLIIDFLSKNAYKINLQ